MSTKSYKLRLDLRADQPVADCARFCGRADEIGSVGRWLDDTREVFNNGVTYLTGWLLRMHRGAGVCREKRDGIWREWQEITTLDALNEARSRHEKDPGSFALLENRELLDAFRDKGKSEAEAVELAECCRRIAKELCPSSEDSSGAQMPRDDLDLLTLETSTAKGVRDRGVDKTGKPKQKSGRRPRWMLKQAIAATAPSASSWSDFEARVTATTEFQSAANDGKSLLKQLKQKHTGAWCDVQTPLCEYANTWEADKAKAEKRVEDSAVSGSIAAYRRLLELDCLPLPGLQRPSAYLRIDSGSAEWNYAIWNMAGQRVRSHLGWVRRRATERLLWELRTSLFERGGWIRTKRDGKPIRKDGLTPYDIQFENPPDGEAGDFEQRHAFAGRKWVEALREYETDEMPKHLEATAFSAAEQPRIRRRTAKGWAKVRDKWIDLIAKASKAYRQAPSADDLLEAFDQMRTRKARDFGDRRLFEWLASPERRWLWDGTDKCDDNDCGREDRDCLTAFIAHNEHLADQPKSITWTRVDPVKHPVWPFFSSRRDNKNRIVSNSAVAYRLRKETTDDGHRLLLICSQLLTRQDDGTYRSVNDVCVALRGYDDFERSIALPANSDVSASDKLLFLDDLLGGKPREGTLSGMKVTWERDELEASHRKCKPTRKPPRIYANFSCDAGEAELPEWLTKGVGYLDKKNARDGIKGLFKLDGGIRFEGKAKKSASDDTAKPGTIRPPGTCAWPKDAIDHGFTVRGTDLGYRTSSAGALWRLSFTKPDGRTAWQVGKCEGKPVYAVLVRTSTVSLPGDGEALPTEEQALREQLYSLRTRLNLNNSLLRIARLLALEAITQRKADGAKVRKRAHDITKRIGTKWKTETRSLDETEIKANCRKAAEQLVRWASTDAMTESLKAIGHEGSMWDLLAGRDASLKALAERVPTTEVPTEKQAKEQRIDRDTAKAKRQAEDEAFAEAVHQLCRPLAKAMCDGHDAERRRRATAGLWFEFDRALMREGSYGDSGDRDGRRDLFEKGLLRLLRKPPVTKHGDRKDEANNLPHGRTHRGGVSMNRLNFLDDVKNFVRRWSCRPRWPGDVRRVPRDAKVNRGDTEHLDHLREHRAKLIAHADVAQTLGFEQDLRRGLWRYRDISGQLLWHRPERGHWYREHDGGLLQCQPAGSVSDTDARHPHPAYKPAHVLVYEDLTRYRMSSDRPKNENAGLARWSHRQILAFAQHIGGLFGVPVATVDARFSSRYCSHCGAPGCRAVRFDPAWLGQTWMKRLLQSNDVRDAAMKRVATNVRSRTNNDAHALDCEEDRPWVLRDGGTHFVCANTSCPVHSTPIDADENAAGNVGLRFLRGIDGIRATINGNGAVSSSIGYVAPGTVLEPVGDGEASEREPYWSNRHGDRSRTPAAKAHKGVQGASTPADDIEDEYEPGGVRVLFRDPSGGFRVNDRWFEGKFFWGAVARACAAGINATNASRFGATDDD
ncbi:MAG: type V CRISPR-associated protein Cas12b [Phycisphaeraceae bacterium]|nr:MAG: type V CRISPR-associated protein Cas12b [Phycisphaeraceae bacterium]